MKKNYYFVLFYLVILSLFVSIVPINSKWQIYLPFFPLIFFAIWLLKYSGYFQLSIAFVFGIVIDYIIGDRLGTNALSMVLSSSYLLFFRFNFLKDNLIIQILHIAMATFIYATIGWLLSLFYFKASLLSVLFWSPITSVICWIFIYYIYFNEQD